MRNGTRNEAYHKTLLQWLVRRLCWAGFRLKFALVLELDFWCSLLVLEATKMVSFGMEMELKFAVKCSGFWHAK